MYIMFLPVSSGTLTTRSSISLDSHSSLAFIQIQHRILHSSGSASPGGHKEMSSIIAPSYMSPLAGGGGVCGEVSANE